MGLNEMKFFRWILFVSGRFSKVDRKGRTAVTSFLASLGVCFGVMALTVVMGVMNGFQMSFIDSIMEISSYHVRISGIQSGQEKDFLDFCNENKRILCVTPFKEAQGLMADKNGLQAASVVRAVPVDALKTDSGLKRELKIISGKFDLKEKDSIVIGNTIAYNLNLRRGSKVNIAALSGSSDAALLSTNRIFTVKGIFFCGHADINAGYSFISLDAGDNNFGKKTPFVYGLKLKNSRDDSPVIKQILSEFDGVEAIGWREYNRGFFGVLRMEKNILFLLVLLIFVVVAINIYNAFRKLVFERKTEIAVLSAFGGSKWDIRSIFLVQGFKTGIFGALPGMFLGIFVSKNIASVFKFFGAISGNSMFDIYANIPSRLFPHEVFLIFMFGLCSAMGASWLAGKSILRLTVSEVLRDE